MQFDDPTLMLAVSIAAIANAMVLIWAALLGAGKRPLLFWAAGSTLMAAAAMTNLLLTDYDMVWSAPLFNAAFMLGHACYLVGTLHFLSRAAPARTLAVVLLACVALTIWLGVISPNREWRIFHTALTAALLRLATAFVLLRHGGIHNRLVSLAAALVIFIDGGVLVRHAFIGLTGAAAAAGGPDPYAPTWICMLLNTAVAMPLLMLLALSRLLNDLQRSAHQDSLTRLPNRRGFFERIGPLLAQGRRLRQRGSVLVLVLDIDYFKRLNDRFGHAVGDEVLYAMGATLRAVLRGADTAVRWGGEEFCVLLPATDGMEAQAITERIRAEFSRRCREIPVLADEAVSASIGIACGQWDQADFDAIQRRADVALYAAKHGGRDRSAFAVEAPTAV